VTQLALYDVLPPDPLREQFARAPEETHVLMDTLLQCGAKLDALEDAEVERQRIDGASKAGLVRCEPKKDFMSGKRPAAWDWGRKIRSEDRYDIRRINRELAYVAREPKRVPQLFSQVPKWSNPERRLMTSAEVDLAIALHRCRYAPATFEKRFAADMSHRAVHEVHPTITEKQAAVMQRMAHRYRKQLAAIQTPSNS